MYLQPEMVLQQFAQCQSDRSNTENTWQECFDYHLPRKNDVVHVGVAGERKGVTLLDSTGMNSAELLASSLHGMLTSPVAFFFGLTTGNLQIDQMDSVRLWIQEVVRTMHFVINNSNFQTEVHEYYNDLVVAGNGALWVEEDVDDVIRFQARALREVYVKENSKGRIDTSYRSYQLDPRGLVEDFGLENLPDRIKEEYKAGKSNKHEVVHSIYPRSLTSETRKNKFPFISQYILKSDKAQLSVGGFKEFPLIYGRWSKIPGEVYGRGPAERALPENKTINKMTEITLRGAQKVVDPPLQAPDDGFVMPLVTRPGGFNYYRAGSKDRIESIFNDSRVDFGYQFIDRKSVSIREAFYVDQMKLKDGPQMTATEVNERVEQALRFMGPMLGRQQSEFLSPLVGRIYSVMERRGQIPQAPQELAGQKLFPQYSSVMAASQRMSEMQNINRYFQGIAPMVAIDPSINDLLNGDKVAKHVAKLTNLPQELIRDEKEVQAIRQQRAEAAEKQQQMLEQEMEAKNATQMIGAAAKMQQPA